MYESMTLRIILNEGFKHEGVRRYFPEDRDLHRLPRDWCLNTIYSIVGKPWKDWVDNQREQRNDGMRDKKGLTIDFAPSIAEIFANSTAVSSK